MPSYTINSKDVGGHVVIGAHALRFAQHSIGSVGFAVNFAQQHTTTMFRQLGIKTGTDDIEDEG